MFLCSILGHHCRVPAIVANPLVSDVYLSRQKITFFEIQKIIFFEIQKMTFFEIQKIIFFEIQNGVMNWYQNQ